MTGRIYLSKADTTDIEEEFVLNALRSGWIAPLGPDVDAFEREIAERLGVTHALALTSGTAALHLALLEVGAGPGTVVVLPSMTFAASANAVTYTGAAPVFVDSQASDGNVDPVLLIDVVDRLLAEGEDVCAVMTVDLFGRAANYSLIAPALTDRGIPLIEDAAEALGAEHRGRQAGSFGRAAALSFNGNKIMTTSGGGMLLSDDESFIAHARKLSTQAREPVAWYEHEETGYNYRLSNILAALGRGQLRRLDDMIARRREIRQIYREVLTDQPGVRFLGVAEEDSADNGWLTCLVVDRPGSERMSDSLVEQLNAQGIEARHLWKPMHLQPVFASARAEVNGTSERLFRTGLALPSGPNLTDTQILKVTKTVNTILS